MKIDFTKDDQLKNLLGYVHGRMYFVLHKFSLDNKDKNTKVEWIRLAAPFVGIASGLLTITTRVALIAEDFFKGTCNILFSCIFPKMRLAKGIQQLFRGALINTPALLLSFFDAIKITIYGVRCLFGAELKNYSETKWLEYDLVAASIKKHLETLETQRRQLEEKKRLDAQNEATRKANEEKERAAKEAQEKKDKGTFNSAFAATQSENVEASHWLTLADLYQRGVGVVKNPVEYQNCLKNAADLNHPGACYLYAENLAKAANEITSEALEYYRKSSDSRAAARVAEFTLAHDKSLSNEDIFNNCLILANDGNLAAQWLVGLMYATGRGVDRDFSQAYEWFTDLGRNIPIEGEALYEDVKKIVDWGRNAQFQIVSWAGIESIIKEDTSGTLVQLKGKESFSYPTVSLSAEFGQFVFVCFRNKFRDHIYDAPDYYNLENIRIFVKPFGVKRTPRLRLETEQQRNERVAAEAARSKQEREKAEELSRLEYERKMNLIDQQKKQQHQDAEAELDRLDRIQTGIKVVQGIAQVAIPVLFR